jgi:hypothetical protein
MRGIVALMIVLALLSITSPSVEAQGVACSNYDSQAEAQAAFDANPAGLRGLDFDGDGIACEPAVKDSRDSVPQESTVRKTFELSLNGRSAGKQVEVVAGAVVTDAESRKELVTVAFCGLPGLLPCAADGTVYRETVKFERGSRVNVRFVLNGLVFDEPVVLRHSTETLDGDTTNSASYDFGSDGAASVAGMPQAGAGGAADHSAYWASGTVALSISSQLAFIGYAALRRRRWRTTQGAVAPQ